MPVCDRILLLLTLPVSSNFQTILCKAEIATLRFHATHSKVSLIFSLYALVCIGSHKEWVAILDNTVCKLHRLNFGWMHARSHTTHSNKTSARFQKTTYSHLQSLPPEQFNFSILRNSQVSKKVWMILERVGQHPGLFDGWGSGRHTLFLSAIRGGH